MIKKTTIRWISIIVIFTSCAVSAQPPRKLIVPDEYGSIKAAMMDAASGDTVFVKSGVYEEGDIFLPEGVKLVGEGMDNVTIQNNISSGQHVIIADRPSGLIKGLTIAQVGTTESRTRPSGILLINSSVEVAECRVRNITGTGIEIRSGGKPLVHDCITELNGFCGIKVWGQGSEPIIRDNLCRANQQQGIYFSKSSNGIAKNNICQDNKNGIMVIDEGTNATLVDNQCRTNKDYGIYICRGANSLAEGNICEKNIKTGILIYQKGTTATLKGNRCQENGEDGILFTEASTGLAEQNICKANGRSGISIYNGWAEATLKNNECLDNKSNGIWFAGKCGGTAEDNLCQGNASNGISLMYKGVAPRLIGNRCLENGGSGIYFGRGAAGTVEENICNGNQWHGISVADVWSLPALSNNTCLENARESVYIEQGEFGSVRRLLTEEKFEELEQIASRLREQKSRSYTGGWQLSDFYRYLSDDWATMEPSKEEWLFGLIRQWIKLKPESITPRIVLARVYMALAWAARGGGWASTVTPEGRNVFIDNLIKAQEVLQQAEKLESKDPELDAVFMNVGFALGKSQFEMEPLFLKGIDIERNYHSLYLVMANYLQPKWHGWDGELEAFADRAAHLTKEQEGESLYAIVAQVAIPKSKTANPDDFLKFKFSYDRIKQGFGDILQRYPRADYYRNCYCFIAAIHKDKETAVQLFDKIGNNWNGNAWCFEKYFKKYRDWAYSQGQ